jgi:hypothetical protein
LAQDTTDIKQKTINSLSTTVQIFFIINKKGIWTHTLPFDATIETISSAILKSDTLSEHENQYPESRKVKLIPTTQCPLNSKTCQFQIQNETFQVELANRTVRPQYENRFILKSISQKPSELTPIEIDIEGVDLYMGLNRPQFSKNQNQYEVNFNLPMCEIKKMKWKSTLIFKSKFNQYFAVQYFFKSEDQ